MPFLATVIAEFFFIFPVIPSHQISLFSLKNKNEFCHFFMHLFNTFNNVMGPTQLKSDMLEGVVSIMELISGQAMIQNRTPGNILNLPTYLKELKV